MTGVAILYAILLVIHQSYLYCIRWIFLSGSFVFFSQNWDIDGKRYRPYSFLSQSKESLSGPNQYQLPVMTDDVIAITRANFYSGWLHLSEKHPSDILFFATRLLRISWYQFKIRNISETLISSMFIRLQKFECRKHPWIRYIKNQIILPVKFFGRIYWVWFVKIDEKGFFL